MSNRPLQISAALCILFCFFTLTQQVYFLLYAPAPDPYLAKFAANYRVTSSIETAIIVAVGVGLSTLLIFRQTPIRGFAVGVFCLFILRRMFISHLGIYFHPGVSDGTLAGAASVWWHIHGRYIWIYGIYLLLLLSSSIVALVESYVLYKRNKVV